MTERGVALQAQQLTERLMVESNLQRARAEQVTAFLVDAEAEQMYRRLLGEQHPWFAAVLNNRAHMEHESGQLG